MFNVQGMSNHFQAHSVAEVLEKYNNSKTPDNTLIKVNDCIFYHFYSISLTLNDDCGTTIEHLFQITNFLHGLLHVPVGLSVGGLFLITRESCLTVSTVSLIVCY